MTPTVTATTIEISNQTLIGIINIGIITNKKFLFLEAADWYCFVLQCGHLILNIDFIVWPQVHVFPHF